MAEKGFQFAEVTHEVEPLPGGPEAGQRDVRRQRRPEGQDPRHRLHRQQGDQRRHAASADEGEQGTAGSCRGSPAAAPTRRTKFEEDAEQDRRVLPRTGLHPGARRPARDEGARGQRRTAKTRWVELRIPVDRRPALPGSASSTSTATRSSRPTFLRPLFKLKAGDWYSREDDPQGLREGARDLRQRRLLRVHRLPGSAVQRRSAAEDAPRVAGPRPSRPSSTSRCA